MRYLGGKSRLGGRIVQAILADLGVKRIGVAVDLCAGAGGVTRRLADIADKVVAVEAHPGLVALMQKVQGGWVPPEHVSEAEYKASFAVNWSDPLATFMGFGCAFGGDWRHGYAKDNRGDNYAQQSSKALRRDARANVEHVNADALAFETDAEVVYCDPPYEGTAGYAVPAAVTGAWWHRLAALAEQGRACYLSEYAEAPPDGVEARCVWTAPTHKTQLTKGTRTERLWRVLPSEEWDSALEREAA